ncbi:hypothetical protein AB0L70_01985 [Kribbella sp. NPDC051952]|uniref:hypothetical protein n=1 Tax=Kribbella sp. NPDC051952 TaxID=3154851 RepID=UPI0034221434
MSTSRSWRWLWLANGIAVVVMGAAAILQPIAMLSAPCGPNCDPHGYVAIFMMLPAVGIAGLALVALTLLIARSASGFGTGLAAAVCCGGLAFLLTNLLPGYVRWPILAAATLAVALAIAGLRLAPPAPRIPRRLEEPPYPPMRRD